MGGARNGDGIEEPAAMARQAANKFSEVTLPSEENPALVCLRTRNQQCKPKVNHMKLTCVVGIIAVLVAASARVQAGCDGPVTVTGSTTGCGACPGCSGTATVINDHTECGGCDYTYCNSVSATIGRSGVTCVARQDTVTYLALVTAYNDCMRTTDRNTTNPIPVPCVDPNDASQVCRYTHCEGDTTGGTAITGTNLDELGDDNSGCCNVAMIEKPASSFIKLALLILGEK